MITYFIIGIIVQLLIIVERTIRIPGIWTDWKTQPWEFWITLLCMIIINVLLWPFTILCEIFAILNGI